MSANRLARLRNRRHLYTLVGCFVFLVVRSQQVFCPTLDIPEMLATRC